MKIQKTIWDKIESYCKIIIEKLNPNCIILYGSAARGDYNERSDIDLIIISSELPENYYQRGLILYDLNDTGEAIEPIGYTPDEFLKMIKKRHCTTLFAMEEGKPLYGEEYFNNLLKLHKKIMKKHGIIKGISAWIPTKHLKN